MLNSYSPWKDCNYYTTFQKYKNIFLTYDIAMRYKNIYFLGFIFGKQKKLITHNKKAIELVQISLFALLLCMDSKTDGLFQIV